MNIITEIELHNGTLHAAPQNSQFPIPLKIPKLDMLLSQL